MDGSDVGIGEEAAQAARQEAAEQGGEEITLAVRFNKRTGQMRVQWPQDSPMEALGLLDMIRDFILTQMKGGGNGGSGSGILAARGQVPRNPDA